MLKINFYYKDVKGPFSTEADKSLISFSHKKTKLGNVVRLMSEVQPQSKFLFPLYKDLELKKIEILLDGSLVLEVPIGLSTMAYSYEFSPISGVLAENIMIELN